MWAIRKSYEELPEVLKKAPYFWSGYIRGLASHPNEMREEFRAFQAANPENPALDFLQLSLESVSQEWAEVVAVGKKLGTLVGPCPRLGDLVGFALMKLSKYEEAATHLERTACRKTI